MNTPQIRSVFIGALLIVFSPHIVQAVVISDVMFDPAGSDAGHEWVSISNDGAAPLTITRWRIVVAGKKHKIQAVAGDGIVAPGASAIIADNPATYAADHPEYHGILLDSTFSLPNAGGTVSLLDETGATVATKTYTATPKPKAATSALKKRAKSSKKTKAAVAAAQEPVSSSAEDAGGESTAVYGVPHHIASVQAAGTPAGVWFAGVGVLVLAVMGIVVYARRAAQREESIADMPQDTV